MKSKGVWNSGFTVVEEGNEMVWNLVMDQHIFFLSKQCAVAAQATTEPSCQPPGFKRPAGGCITWRCWFSGQPRIAA